MSAEPQPPGLSRVTRVGRTAWAAVGVLILVAVAGWLLIQLRVVVVPLVIALFPAALLAPVSARLKKVGVSDALAALLTVVAALGVLAGIGAVIVPLIASELPAVVDSITEAVDEVQQFLQGTFLGNQLDALDQPLEELLSQLGGGSDMADRTIEAVATVAETIAEVLLFVVAVFFYLKDGGRIARGLLGFVPQRIRRNAEVLAGRIWDTIGAYFRGQLLVALGDAVGIGLGLLVLGVPLVLPLAVLVFFGGLFPIVGAFVSGLIAVMVGLADQGLITALLVLAVVVAVQQLESNVMEPVILSHSIHLHPLMVLTAISAGAITLGVLGAFLAVPVAASIARTVEFVREQRQEAPAEA